MNVFSIFKSIDGEVNWYGQGTQTVFVRLAGCNIKCAYCFGIINGRKIPRIITSRVPNKKLMDMKVGDWLMTFDENKNLVETEVKEVITREVNSWFRLKINGVSYFVTEEHPFFTTKGMIKTKNLKIGDMILHSSPNQKASFSKMGERNPMKDPRVARKSGKGKDYKKIGIKISSSIKKKQEQGIYLHPFSTLSERKYKETKKKLSLKMMGDKNPNWRGGINTNYNYLKNLCKKGIINTCKECGKTNIKCCVHHKDADKKNDDWENLLISCYPCHNKIHKRGYSFWRGERKDGKNLSVKSRNRLTALNGYKVEEIKHIDRNDYPPSTRPKPLKVWNISCFPYNSYLVDYMWVHNCDTKYAQSPDSGTETPVKKVFDQIMQLGTAKVTITGGEPLLQIDEVAHLVSKLAGQNIVVTIETNGTWIPPTLAANWVVDYKCPSSGMAHYVIGRLNFVRKLNYKDFVKFVVDGNNDLDFAINKIKMFNGMGLAARMAISPVNTGFADISVPDILKELNKHNLHEVVINTQLHKLIDLKEVK